MEGFACSVAQPNELHATPAKKGNKMSKRVATVVANVSEACCSAMRMPSSPTNSVTDRTVLARHYDLCTRFQHHSFALARTFITVTATRCSSITCALTPRRSHTYIVWQWWRLSGCNRLHKHKNIYIYIYI